MKQTKHRGKCDFCGAVGLVDWWDAPTHQGPWANACSTCAPTFLQVNSPAATRYSASARKASDVALKATPRMIDLEYANVTCPHCDYSQNVEPDADGMYCDSCGSAVVFTDRAIDLIVEDMSW